MKILSSIFSFMALILSAHADLPAKPSLTRYSSLWNDSPFTSKPPPPTQAPTVNPLDDFALTGVAPIKGGYRITIVNKNDRTNKKVIDSTKPGEIQLISVNRIPGKSFQTSVVLATASGLQGTVSFDRELIKPNPAPSPENNKQPGQSNIQGNQIPQQQQPIPPVQRPTIQNGPEQVNTPSPPVRAPRPRVVPNASGSPNQQGNQNRNSDRFRRR